MAVKCPVKATYKVTVSMTARLGVRRGRLTMSVRVPMRELPTRAYRLYPASYQVFASSTYRGFRALGYSGWADTEPVEGCPARVDLRPGQRLTGDFSAQPGLFHGEPPFVAKYKFSVALRLIQTSSSTCQPFLGVYLSQNRGDYFDSFRFEPSEDGGFTFDRYYRRWQDRAKPLEFPLNRIAAGKGFSMAFDAKAGDEAGTAKVVFTPMPR